MSLTDEQQAQILALAEAGDGADTIGGKLNLSGPYVVFPFLHGKGWRLHDGELTAPKAAQTAEQKEKAARKQHKLEPQDIPNPLPITFASDDWRHYPGMPDLLINRAMVAAQLRYSRRRGHYFKHVPLSHINGVWYFAHWKGNTRTNIRARRAMYECGFWQEKPKDAKRRGTHTKSTIMADMAEESP